MKNKLACLIGIALICCVNISCENIHAEAGVPVPFTSGVNGAPVRVAVDVHAKLLPPKFCIGLDVKE